MRVLKWLAWIVVIAFASALPWLVQDWIVESPPESATSSQEPPVVEQAPTPEPQTPLDPPAPDTDQAPIVEETERDATPKPPDRSLGAKISDFLQETWLKVQGTEDANTTGSIHSDRSREAAKRIAPRLIAELTEKNLTLGQPVFLRVFKESSELEVWMEPTPGGQHVLFKTYPICAWSGDLGPKLTEGDGQSPEGFYFVPPGRMNPQSRFHLSFDIGFPNDYDQHHGRTGSFLMVHGDCVSIGCYAMTDPAIEEIYTLATSALENGQSFFRVHAFPFRMTDEKMDTLKEDGEWFEFWSNLKEGYDYFEYLSRPPNATVVEGKYQFN